jgi:hypothetical protein
MPVLSPDAIRLGLGQGKNLRDIGGGYFEYDEAPLATSPSEQTASTNMEAAKASAPADYGADLNQYMEQQITNPGLPPGTEFRYKPIEENENELLQNQTPLGTTNGDTTQGTASQIDPSKVPGVNPNSGQYDPTLVNAAQGEVTKEMTVRGQLESLYSDFEPGKPPPAWASGAIRTANETMASRGLAASTLAGMSIAQAVMEAAFPIASFDAKVFDEQAFLNQRMRQEALLSNQAAENAAKQFGAKNLQEVEMFMATMAKNIEEFNAGQKNAMESLNVQQSNAMKQFYSAMNDKREQFNATMSYEIQKSNAEWRRQLNLANTAGENAETMMNVQNRFNLSQQAMANLWQEARDVFQWAQVAAENDKDRAFKLATYQLQRGDALSDRSHEERNLLASTLGQLGSRLVFDTEFDGSTLASKALSGLGNLFS